MPYWDTWIEEDSRFRLPRELRSQLMDPEEAEDRLATGFSAVLLSLDKWERISKVFKAICLTAVPLYYFDSLRSYVGYKTCALCLESKRRLQSDEDKADDAYKCDYCALANIERCTSRDSAFLQIDRILEMSPLDVSDERKEERIRILQGSIEKMISNLRTLSEVRSPNPLPLKRKNSTGERAPSPIRQLRSPIFEPQLIFCNTCGKDVEPTFHGCCPICKEFIT